MRRTAYLTHDIYLRHETGRGHPERPKRLTSIDKKIKSADYYNDLVLLEPEIPDLRHIEKIHSADYITRVKKTVEKGKPYLDSADTGICGYSYEAALMAAGGGLTLCDAVMRGSVDNGFCAIRPPGHHAEWDYAAGFCIFNNIAIAARYLQDVHGLKKIGIIDWDVHHGNGTQHSFEDDNTVYYISIHQHPHYPGTGAKYERGKGKGEGYTLNIPMHAGSDDRDYIRVFEDLIVAALDDFKPEFILISAGFDAHTFDRLSSIELSTGVYRKFTEMMLGVADRHSSGKVVAFLEGGYNLAALSDSVDMVLRALHSG
jgi:acetoin utilization deacetylase AcuC-like enzyme